MKNFGLFLVALMAALGSTGNAMATGSIWGVWDWPFSEPVQVVVSPGGSGPSLTQASLYGGATVDATIRIQLWYQYDSPPAPVPDFPAEDIWLEAPGLVSCMGGANADADTDEDGWFTFSHPLRMGGRSQIENGPPYMHVVVNGSWLEDLSQYITPTIIANSPDINGDLVVNLGDLGLFADNFFGEYDFRSDFYWDGVLNLSDVGRMATTFGEDCP